MTEHHQLSTSPYRKPLPLLHPSRLSPQFQDWLTLGIIWLLGAVSDRIWFAFDRDVPAWDQADYLTGTLNYWQALQNPQWFSSEWWRSFWQLTSKVPPLTYIVTGMVQSLFGRGPDRATLVNLLLSAILLVSVYGLGVLLFNRRVGLWAAGLCLLLPGLYRYRLDFLLDYPLTAIVTLSFCCLTVWKFTQREVKSEEYDSKSYLLHSPRIQAWFWAAAFGLSLGLALLVKQTALFFLLIPILGVIVGSILKRKWERLAQLAGSLLLSVLVFGPWYRTNWLLMLTAGKRATIDSAIAEGDPPLNTLDAWIYYWKILPYLVSWPLLLVPIVGILLYCWKSGVWRQKTSSSYSPSPQAERELGGEVHSFKWLAVFLIGAYLLCSLNVNKDARYVLPYLPVVSLLLAYGLTCWTGRWGKPIRWGTVGLATLLMLLNSWPIGGSWLTQRLSPRVQHYAYLGTQWPHQQVIDEIIKTEPFLRETLGVLPSTPTINQHNFNYYGALKDFQVYGRQVGTRKKFVPQDARSLSWFLTKTGDQGSVPTEAQSAIVQLVEQGSDFQLHKTWSLPDESTLNLYHRRLPPIQVQPLTQNFNQVRLTRVTVPEASPPGVPLPVTYEWSGSWEELQSGLVLLTWRNIAVPLERQTNQSRWLHDHGIGMGNIDFRWNFLSKTPESAQSFRVTERMAMLPPKNIAPGIYTLEATYLNRQTGAAYRIPVSPTVLNIDPTATATPAPELDLITQLRSLAAELPKGPKAIEPVFDQTGRINQYDPIQDYLKQASQALDYRLRQEPKNLTWAYALALAQVLQRQVDGAITALERVTQLDSQNPYAYAYLAFVNLYDWRAASAQTALKPALASNPNLSELQVLSGTAALMQGNFFQAWHNLKPVVVKN